MSLIVVFTLGFLGFCCVSTRALPYWNWRSNGPQGPNYHPRLDMPVRPPPPLDQAQSFFGINCSSVENEGSLHPHPLNCNLYLKCVHGFTMERPCAPGTEFSPSIGVCVHYWQSDCGADNREGSGLEVEDESTVSNVEENSAVTEKSIGFEQLDKVRYHKEVEELIRTNGHSEEQEKSEKRYEHQSNEHITKVHKPKETSTSTKQSITETSTTLIESETTIYPTSETHKNHNRTKTPRIPKESKLSVESERNKPLTIEELSTPEPQKNALKGDSK